MKRYYVFSYTTYYPEGGMRDCILRTEDVEEAVACAVHERDESFNHASVWDVVEMKYVMLPEEE